MSMQQVRGIARRRASVLAASAMMVFASAGLAQQAKEGYLEFERPEIDLPNGAVFGGSQGLGIVAGSGFVNSAPLAAQSAGLSFKGVTQFDLRAVNLGGGFATGTSFIPPDTMGAVGATQFMETTNGVYAIYNKATGALQSKITATDFWVAAGSTSGINGDARVLFDKASQRWIAIQFGASVADIQIAVSNTSNALGSWQTTKFTGFAGGTADYPTLAIDSKAVYIGTNNFNAAGTFSGTTLNVIPRADLLGGGTPTAANVKQFVTPYVNGGSSNQERGFAIQGVNSSGPLSGMVVAAALFTNDSIRYNVANPGTAGATLGPVAQLGLANYAGNLPARQPDQTRNIDSFDERISSSAWEQNGKIYSIYTATPLGGTHTEVRWFIIDAITNAIIQQGAIGDDNYDYYQGSLAVNEFGQVVIGYDRSGFQTGDANGDGYPDGNVSFFARTYFSDASGRLYQTNEFLLHVSPVSDYHNGSLQGQPAAGRQRWGDYSAVTVDPNDSRSFWAIGEYAELWNNAAGCGAVTPPIPGCGPPASARSSWGTWISNINVGTVPEPQTYALMIVGLLAIGATMRRKVTTRV